GHARFVSGGVAVTPPESIGLPRWQGRVVYRAPICAALAPSRLRNEPRQSRDRESPQWTSGVGLHLCRESVHFLPPAWYNSGRHTPSNPARPVQPPPRPCPPPGAA